jgi:acyl-CoA synthetase (AMP-forming)/AMP-acid ligase II
MKTLESRPTTSPAIDGTMMDVPLTVTWVFEHVLRNSPSREIVSKLDDGTTFRYTYAGFGKRVAQLAHALVELGVRPGDRVGTFGWNTHRHMELYYAVPMIGAVLHTINIRLFPEQVVWVIDHAGDSLVFVDASLATGVANACATLGAGFVTMGKTDALPDAHDYETLLAGKPETFDWPDIDEHSPSMICYTSATTGDPKGVVSTHRSNVLHALTAGLSSTLGIAQSDTVMPVVPMFHVGAWGVPYIAPMVGAKLVLPGPKLDPQSVIDLVRAEGVTFSLGVPTVWLAVRDALEKDNTTLPTLKTLVIGGSAVPPSLFDDLEKKGITVVHAWGMTEMSPIGTVCRIVAELADAPAEVIREKRLKQGRFAPLVAWKILDEDGKDVPRDGKTPGDLWVRGHAITASYYRVGNDLPAFKDGYFHTGDVCTIDEYGYLQLVDRSKDLVKSGGEWISSVDLENTIMGHQAIREAAVIGLAHEKWVERPVAVVALREGQSVDEAALQAWIGERVAKWMIPDRIVFVDAIPRTGVGKFLKRDLRDKYKDLLL